MRTLLAAPDKFRGSATAPEVAAAIAAAAEAAGWACVQLPLADGGEGMLDAFGGANRTSVVTGPLGTPVEAPWRMGDDGVAVVESARASGLTLAGGAERNDPVGATSRGTGELVTAAIAAGAHRVIVGLGGSATTDGGVDIVDVLAGFAPLDGRDGHTEVLVACDVRTTFRDAAAVFGPQKGASPEQVVELTARLDRLAALYRQRFGVDLAALPGSGAAGGLGGALAALGARLVPGFDLIARQTGLPEAVGRADAVVTGEGRLDASSFAGKIVGGVLALAAERHVPTLVVAGTVDAEVADRAAHVSLVSACGADAAWADPQGCVTEVTRAWLDRVGTGP